MIRGAVEWNRHMKQALIRRLAQIARWPHLDAAVLILGVSAYAAQVLSTMTRWSIWFDEGFSAYISRFSFLDIAHYTAVDVHPPLYYWTLKIWTFIFGTGEIGVRSMSLMFGMVAIVLGFLLVKRLFGRRAAWMSLLFLVISPMLIRYGQEARMYTMTAAIALAATYTLTFAVTSKKWTPWVIYGVLIGIGMWTHYFIAVVWIGHWVWRAVTVWHLRYRGVHYIRQFFSRQWIVAHLIAIAVFLPWAKSMVDQLLGIQIGWFWIDPVGVDTLTNYLSTVFFFQQHNEVAPWVALLFIVVCGFLAILTGMAYRQSNAVQRKNYLLIFCLAVLPVLLVFVASLPPLRPSFVERYLMTSVVGFSLFAGIVIAMTAPKLKAVGQVIIVGLVAGAMLIGVVHAQTIGNFNKSSGVSIETKAVIQGIASRSSGQEPIISRSPWLFFEAVFYESAQHPVYYLKSTVEASGSGSLAMLQGDDSHNITDLTTFARQHPVVWYFGEPGGKEIPAPAEGWKVLQSFRIDDPVTGKQRYQAVQFSTRP